MSVSDPSRDIPLPRSWPNHIKVGVVHAISIAHAAVVCSRGWAVNSSIERARLASELRASENEVSLLKEEIRIKDGRTGVERQRIWRKTLPGYRPRLGLSRYRWEMKGSANENLSKQSPPPFLEPLLQLFRILQKRWHAESSVGSGGLRQQATSFSFFLLGRVEFFTFGDSNQSNLEAKISEE